MGVLRRPAIGGLFSFKGSRKDAKTQRGVSVGALKGATHGRFAGVIFGFLAKSAPFGNHLYYWLSATDPMGALPSVVPFAPDPRNSLATDFLSMPSARAICRWLVPEAKSCVIPCVLSIESLFGIGDSS